MGFHIGPDFLVSSDQHICILRVALRAALTYEGCISEFQGTWGKNWKYHSISIKRGKMLAQTLVLGKISFSVFGIITFYFIPNVIIR